MMKATCLLASDSPVRSAPFAVTKAVLLHMALAGFFLVTSCSKPKVEPFGQAGSERNYTLGKKIIFGQAGDSERFRTSGWSSTEKEITWTEGPIAVLQFAGLPPSTSLRLKMTLLPLTSPPRLPSQNVEVYANGQKIADWQISSKAEFTALIPPTREGPEAALTIELRIPQAVSPKELGLSDDPRVLGISCFDLTIDKVG
jgi:hypothetical protein